METKYALLALRKELKLSQKEFAKKIFVTRQAVSRWENGDTMPSLDTMQLIANTFHVSIDYLLGRPVGSCQSCGMPLENDSDKGSESDGRTSEVYCAFCYQEGTFTQNITMEEMIAHNIEDLDQWNQSAGLQVTKQEASAALAEFLPTLKRWGGK